MDVVISKVSVAGMN